MKDLAIYINSFDGYSDIWSSFFYIWNYYWKDCPYKMYLTSNDKDFSFKNLTVLKSGKETSWIDRTIKTLEMIDEEYIIFFLEDYFISKEVDIKVIEEIVKHLKNNDVFYYQLSNRYNLEQNKKYIKVDKSLPYPISLQLSIWNRKEFLILLKNMKDDGVQSPWDFERYFINKYKNSAGLLKGVEYDTRDIFGYKNGVLQGKWIRDTLNFYKKQGIVIDCSQREVMSWRETMYYHFKVFFSRKLPNKPKKCIKNLMKKFGFKFMTD